MTYGDEKSRDMSRSILPSTVRNFQKHRKQIHKAARVAYRSQQNLEEDISDVVEKNRNWKISQFKLMRRSYDKISPFKRWAVAVTADLQQEDRLSKISSFMPKGAIGEHAIGHIRFNDHFRNDPLSEKSLYNAYDSFTLEKVKIKAFLRYLLIEGGDIKSLNKSLKLFHKTSYIHYADGTYRKVGQSYPRTLQGLHDVEVFVDDVFEATKSCSKIVRENLDEKYHTKIKFGKNCGAFYVLSENYHPEWYKALQLFVQTPKST